jgi:SAM-dependent methyltransferase
MPASGKIYVSDRLARGYAFERPPVHPRILSLVASDLGLTAPVHRALDVGAGAGLSTAALAPYASVVVGLEPNGDMLVHRRAVAPRGCFTIGQAEAPPFADGAFDLVTAAGALNYVDLDTFLPQLARVLAPGGCLVVYDFSSGRRIDGDPRLERWFDTFAARWPFPPGYGFDVARLDHAPTGLRRVGRREFAVALPLDAVAYVSYVLTETNVEQAIQAGERLEDIARWCHEGVADIFSGAVREVRFEGYIVYVRSATATTG